MRIHQILEAPIEDYQLIGDFSRGHSFRHATDRRLVSNPRYVERIKSMFAKTDVDIRMFMVNSTEALVGHAAGNDGYPKREPFVEQGEVSMAWLQKNMPQGLAQIQQQGGLNPQGINILFTNNSGAERRPMTGWIIGHRMGHALLRSGGYQGNTPFMLIYRGLEKNVKEILAMYGQRVPSYKQRGRQGGMENVANTQNYDSAMVRGLVAQIGTFRSARENNIRTLGEFVYECFAQFLITGDIRFNPPPQSLVTGYAWGRPQSSYRLTPDNQEQAEYLIDSLRETMISEFQQALHASVGKFFVM